MTKELKDLNRDELWKLRKEICLNSLYLNDYRNSFGIPKEEVCNFFDSWLEYLKERMIEDIDGFDDQYFFDYIELYDNEEYLWEWFIGLEY